MKIYFAGNGGYYRSELLNRYRTNKLYTYFYLNEKFGECQQNNLFKKDIEINRRVKDDR